MSQRVKPHLVVHKGPLEHPDARISPCRHTESPQSFRSICALLRFAAQVLAFVPSSSSVVGDGASSAIGHPPTEGRLAGKLSDQSVLTVPPGSWESW